MTVFTTGWFQNDPIVGTPTAIGSIARTYYSLAIYEEELDPYYTPPPVGGVDFGAACELEAYNHDPDGAFIGIGFSGSQIRSVAVSYGTNGIPSLRWFNIDQHAFAFNLQYLVPVTYDGGFDYDSEDLVGQPANAVGMQWEWPDGSASTLRPPARSLITDLEVTWPDVVWQPSWGLDTSDEGFFETHDPEPGTFEVRGLLGEGKNWNFFTNRDPAVAYQSGSQLASRPLLTSVSVGTSMSYASPLVVPIPVDNIPTQGEPWVVMTMGFNNQRLHERPPYPLVPPYPYPVQEWMMSSGYDWRRGAAMDLGDSWNGPIFNFTYRLPRYRWILPGPPQDITEEARSGRVEYF